jgi:hypothetical protein
MSLSVPRLNLPRSSEDRRNTGWETLVYSNETTEFYIPEGKPFKPLLICDCIIGLHYLVY